MPRVLITLGVVLIVAGLAIRLGVPLGRLPGDVVLRRGNTTLYVPVVSGLLVSLVLTLLSFLSRGLRR